MSELLKHPLKNWRFFACIFLTGMILAGLFLHKDWNWIFWVGFVIMVAADRATYKTTYKQLRTDQSTAKRIDLPAKFFLLPFLFIWIIPVAFCVFSPFPLVLPVILSATGFAISMWVAFAMYRRGVKRQDVLKDL